MISFKEYKQNPTTEKKGFVSFSDYKNNVKKVEPVKSLAEYKVEKNIESDPTFFGKAKEVILNFTRGIKSRTEDAVKPQVEWYEKTKEESKIPAKAALVSSVQKAGSMVNNLIEKNKQGKLESWNAQAEGINKLPGFKVETYNSYEEMQKDNAFLKLLNSPTGKAITEDVNALVGDIGLKTMAKLKSIGDLTYAEAKEELEARKVSPDIGNIERFAWGAQDVLPEVLIGVLASLGATAISQNPNVGLAVGSSYWTALSAEEQRQKKGEVYSTTALGIDVALDSMIGVGWGKLFKAGKGAITRALSSAGIEAGTEVTQSVLKLADQYYLAETDEERAQVIEDAKKYLLEGEILMEIALAGFAGAGTSAAIDVGVPQGMKEDMSAIGDIKIPKPGFSIEDVSDGLKEEAKKYKSAEEFVGVDSYGVAKSLVIKQKADDLVNDLIDEAGKGTIRLYHGTDSITAKQIRDAGYFQSSKDYPSFFTTSKREALEYANNKTKYRGKGIPEVLEIEAPKYTVTKNPGTGEYETHTGVKLYFKGRDAFVNDIELLQAFEKLPTKSQLEQIWKKANKAKPVTDLATEAKKYKSAEDFVKAQPKLKHGTNFAEQIEREGFKVRKTKDINGALLGEGIYLDKTGGDGAKIFGRDIIDVSLSPNLNIKKIDNIQELYIEKTNFGEPSLIKKVLQEQGFDGVEAKNQIVIFDASNVKTKSQLEQIWKDAQEPVAPKEKKTEKVSIEKSDKKPVFKEELYKQNREFKASVTEVAKQDFKIIKNDIKKGLDKYLGAVSTRLKNINPELKKALRAFEFKVRKGVLEDTKKIKGFLDATTKFSKDDFADFDLARKNGDSKKLQEIIKKYKIGKEYSAVRKVLDDIYKRSEEVGYDIGYKKHYHPRIIKDKKGFLEHFQRGDNWPIIDQAIKAKENALQRYLEPEEKVQLINTLIRGYQQNQISLSETGNMKTRVIDFVGAELNQYYMDSNAALVRYIDQANDAIESRKFFGKGRFDDGTLIDDNIGSYVLRLLEGGKITPEQEVELTDILKARFKPVGTRGFVSLYKNLSYVDTMGSPTSALTQIGDLAWALYKSGVKNTAKSVYKAVKGESVITREDIGIDNIAAEFEEPTKAARAVKEVFRLTGLEKMDAIGKETLINSVITKYQQWAKDGDARLQDALTPVFGEDTAEVVADLKSGDITENVKLLAFNELADMQPILLSEMPEQYLKGGNGRIFYMLKTFTLKQFDIYRNEIFQKIANPSTRSEGLRNLIKLLFFFVLMNATADELKDLLLNRKTSLKDRTVDNILRAVGFSKYLTWKAREEGVGSAMARQILPPFKFIDSVSKDISSGIEKGSETIQSVPIGGKLYYWWFGKGSTKKTSKASKTKSTKKTTKQYFK